MSIRTAIRLKPDTFRGGLETTIQWSTPAAAPGGPVPARAGTVVRIAQLVIYDDTKVGNAQSPYNPGSEATERFVVVCDQEAISLALGSFAGLTYQAAQALWQAPLQAAADRWAPDRDALAKAAGGAWLVPPIVLP